MTDKVQKIREWINKTQDGLMDANGNFENPSEEGAFHILSNLDYYIDSLQEESVSEDLEEFARKRVLKVPIALRSGFHQLCRQLIKEGAQWKEQQMLNKAIDSELFSDGMFTPLISVKDKEKIADIKFGDKVKIILIKHE